MKNTRKAFYEVAPNLVDIGVDEDGIRRYAGGRVLFIDANVFAKIFDNMEEVAGPVIRSRIHKFGETAGREIAAKMDIGLDEISNTKVISLLWKTGFDVLSLRAIRQDDNRSKWQKILGYGTFVGWFGKSEILEYEEGQRIKLEGHNTFEAFSYGRTGRKECEFLRGAVGGMASYFWDKEVEVEETKCSCESLERDVCVFEVKAVGSAESE